MSRPGTNSKIYVAGHRGMVGSAIVRELRERGHDDAELITAPAPSWI